MTADTSREAVERLAERVNGITLFDRLSWDEEVERNALIAVTLRALLAERDAARAEVETWRQDSATAWDKCEQRRVEGEAAFARGAEAMRRAVIEAWSSDLRFMDDGVVAAIRALPLPKPEDKP